jgi:uncharacterized repeat protein (TIGR03837 family)
MPVSCDLFCRVVDNLGDAGVCWRLARQLAQEYAWAVRLWIDDTAPLAGLRPGISPAQVIQVVDGVEIRRWPEPFPDMRPSDVVIEAFACELPRGFVLAMAAQSRTPVWINLEYLSAETWVSGCHGLPSPHPTLPLVKHFFFPGFAPGTGGLIRERDTPVSGFHPQCTELSVSLFCYENPALPELLALWAEGDEPVSCQVADGLPREQVARWLGRAFPVGSRIDHGSLKLVAAPFVPQPDFDARLAAGDLNFVRGEDSFVRAQWVARPFVWQAYPQDEAAQFGKLDAFLDRYLRGLGDDRNATEAVRAFWYAWNGRGDVAATWPAFRRVLPQLTSYGKAWAEEISAPGNLAQNLVRFCRERL